MGPVTFRWICCQIGSREHYAVPRALNRAGALQELITDTWVGPASVGAVVGGRRMAGRYHPDLETARVWAPNFSAIRFEATQRLGGATGWERMLKRNEWFQARALSRLRTLARTHAGLPLCLFAYSYAARHLFAFAKSQGWMTVLGQIDPGPLEERVVRRLHAEHPDLAGAWEGAPRSYWRDWSEEWHLADRVVVNSEWSRSAMLEEGVPARILRVVPLAYEPEVANVRRDWPDRFTDDRPLRVLFLGQVNLRKGMAETIDAMRLLREYPVQFTIVGPVQMNVPEDLRRCPRVRWLGSVVPGEASHLYDQADVFLIPTHSDGFALTQLEAQARGVPVIASRFCGAVVTDSVNGIILPVVSGAAIAAAIRGLLQSPLTLRAMSDRSRVAQVFGLGSVGARLLEVIREEPAA